MDNKNKILKEIIAFYQTRKGSYQLANPKKPLEFELDFRVNFNEIKDYLHPVEVGAKVKLMDHQLSYSISDYLSGKVQKKLSQDTRHYNDYDVIEVEIPFLKLKNIDDNAKNKISNEFQNLFFTIKGGEKEQEFSFNIDFSDQEDYMYLSNFFILSS